MSDPDPLQPRSVNPVRTTFGPVHVWPLAPGAEVRLAGATEAPAPGDVRARRRWDEQVAGNPRLHDGPIWSVRSVNPGTGLISVSPDRYWRYAVRPTIGTGVTMLAVRGVVTGLDSAGVEHVLIGQRSAQTRIYGELWEVVPGGGVPGEKSGGGIPGVGDLLSHLMLEAREEAGITVEPGECRFVGFCHDTYAGGFDVLMHVALTASLEDVRRGMGVRDWEHSHVRWMPVREAAAFDASDAGRISPPTRAIFRSLGWVESGE